MNSFVILTFEASNYNCNVRYSNIQEITLPYFLDVLAGLKGERSPILTPYFTNEETEVWNAKWLSKVTQFVHHSSVKQSYLLAGLELVPSLAHCPFRRNTIRDILFKRKQSLKSSRNTQWKCVLHSYPFRLYISLLLPPWNNMGFIGKSKEGAEISHHRAYNIQQVHSIFLLTIHYAL